MEDLKNRLEHILESCSDTPKCRNCRSFVDGTCTFGCVNERNIYGYRVKSNTVTSPEYSCENFDTEYHFNESTKHVFEDILDDIRRVDEAKKNLELLLSGRITESDFVDIMR